MRPISNYEISRASLSSPPAIPQPRSPWHSPVPYLFGGLAAMLGLIAFALLILACSYWRLSGRVDDSEGGNEQRDVESGGKEKVFEEKILVIMAGDETPSFLATPVPSRASSFGEKGGKMDIKMGEKLANGVKTKEEMMNNHDQTTVQEEEEGEEEEEEEGDTENRDIQETTQQGQEQNQ